MKKNKQAEAVKSTQTATEQLDRSGSMILVGIVACFFLSGFAALLYQIAWLRQFSIVFGTSEIAVATVLAAYMAGLALGSALAGRYLSRIRRPVLTYGLLEGGIAITALSVPWMLDATSAIYIYMMGGQASPPDSAVFGQTLFYLISAFVILALPTGFMGATLPLLTRHAVRTDEETGSRVALLYATNTAGAVTGAVIAGFIILPKLGLNGTVWLGVSVNALVFIIASRLAKHLKPIPEADSKVDSQSRVDGFFKSCISPFFDLSKSLVEKIRIVFQSQPAWILPLMTISGGNAFIYEVLWTRLLNHVLGGSIYAFATMIASFLSGIAIGGGIAGKFASNRKSAAICFSVSQVLIAIMSIFIFVWIEQLIPETRSMQENAIFAILVMLPSTIFIGATFPLAVRILSRHESDAGSSTASIYAWNTVGAIAGAILAGFYLIPELGFEGTIKGAVIVNMILALLATLFLLEQKTVYAGVTIIVLIGIFFLFNPQRPNIILRASALDTADYTNEKEIFFKVGRSSTVLMIDNGGSYMLRTNGLPEALVFTKGGPPTRHSQRWLTLLPVVARPDADSILVVGFGGGMALEGIPPSVKEVDVIELEPEVINANIAIKDLRTHDPLSDSRINVVINDARNALNLTSKKYDIIVSQPSHPWTAGASHLFTREFLALGKDHLQDDGVFVQWMNSQFLNEDLLRSMAATLLSVFEYVRIYHTDSGVLTFLASDSPLDIERQMIQSEGRPIIDDLNHYSTHGMNSVEDVLLTLAVDEEGLSRFAQYADLITDDDNKMATQSNEFGVGITANELFDIFAPYDPLLNINSWVFNDLEDINFLYMATRMIYLNMAKRANKLAAVIPNRSTRLMINALGLDYAGKEDRAIEYFWAALSEDPDNLRAKYHLINNNLAKLALGTATPEIQGVANSLYGAPAALVAGWKYALEGKWNSLSLLDTELAKSETTDQWYAKATQLRADWRLKTIDYEGRFANDAKRLLDRALIINPSLDRYVLRAASAFSIQDPDAFVESARIVGQYIEGTIKRVKDNEYEISKSELDIMIVRLNGLILQMTDQLAQFTSGRAYDVKEFLEEQLNEVKKDIVPER